MDVGFTLGLIQPLHSQMVRVWQIRTLQASWYLLTVFKMESECSDGSMNPFDSQDGSPTTIQDVTDLRSSSLYRDIYTTYFTPPAPPENAEELAIQSYSASSSVTSFSSSSSASFSSSSSAAATTIPAPGYPSPIIREPNNLNSGYFLSGEGYDDVAVLSVPSFVGSSADEIPFQILNTYFLNYAKAMGKKKLIIDVSANGGGTILQVSHVQCL